MRRRSRRVCCQGDDGEVQGEEWKRRTSDDNQSNGSVVMAIIGLILDVRLVQATWFGANSESDLWRLGYFLPVASLRLLACLGCVSLQAAW